MNSRLQYGTTSSYTDDDLDHDHTDEERPTTTRLRGEAHHKSFASISALADLGHCQNLFDFREVCAENKVLRGDAPPYKD